MTDRAPGGDRWRVLLPALAILAVLTAGWMVYRPALGGTFLLDDIPNLEDLAGVDYAASALRFVLQGTA